MSLDELRLEMDKVDSELLSLFSRRMGIAVKIAEQKKKDGLPAYDQKREAYVLDRALENADPELLPYVNSFFRHLFELSRSCQIAAIDEEKGL